MTPLTLFLCITLVCLQGVVGDAPHTGESLYSFQTFGGFIGEVPSAWGSVYETEAKEWTNLRDVFTVETWFWWEGPLTNPFDYELEHEYKPILARHPGESVHNAYAHFHVELIWYPGYGATVLAFSGCGCDELPPKFGQQYSWETCNLGYVLRSDQGIKGPITYLQPKQWHHISYSVDGDGTNTLGTQTAQLVIDGVLVDNITWPLNEGCQGRSIPYQGLGEKYDLFNAITLGYLQNDDVSPQGTNGRIDEVRIWNVPRTVEETRASFDSALLGGESGLVAYYNFNEGPQSGEQRFYNHAGTSDCMEPSGLPRPDPTDRDAWALSSGLDLNSKVPVTSTLPDEQMNSVRFELRGYDPMNSPITFVISELSPSLSQLIASGQARLYDPRSHTTVGTGSSVFRVLEISLVCVENAGECTNFGGDDALWLRYYGMAPNIPGTTSTVYFVAQHPCPGGEYDECGVCGGDNSSCQCTSYHSFANNRMAFSLFGYSAAQMFPLIDMIENTLESSIQYQPGNANFEEQVTNLYETGNIQYGCMDSFICELEELKQEIDSYNQVKREPSELETVEF